ncbi:MAG TPA: hypothetical protein VF520_11560 [Thermoleophilaceae bacterium]
MLGRGAISAVRRGAFALAALAALAAVVAAPAPAHAAESSPNVTHVASVPEVRTAISIAFDGDTMFVSTVHGLYSYDVSRPESPRLLGAFPMPTWENEDMDVDVVRKRVFVSRDPRNFTTPAAPGAFPVGAVHVIDVSDPAHMRQAGLFTLPAGHTSTCVNRCDFLWTAGPIPGVDQPSDWKGRPVFATDVRDPASPVPCPEPIDTARNDGVTDYAHDVQVDSAGVAWVSGAGGVRGYWTEGRHRNPVTGGTEAATACRPVPYGGSGTPDTATPSRFMHNSLRRPGPARPACARHRGTRAARRRCSRRLARWRRAQGAGLPAGLTRDRVLYGTEENVTSDCSKSGRFTTYDLEGTFAGEGFRDTATTHHRMKVLDTWTPQDQEGSSGCASAHYFSSRGGGVFANAFYEQGVRFLDVSNPRDIRQIGWYRPDDADTWAAYWHGGLVYVADLQRGVDVLRFGGEAGDRPAPATPGGRVRFTRMDPAAAYMCPLRPPAS